MSLSYYSQLALLDRCEILIVLNACTDHSEQIVNDFKDNLPLRVISEPALGLSHARNRGWKEARAPFVFYMDDDAYPSANLIEILLHTLSPTTDAISGRTVYWKADDPAWIKPGYVEVPRFLTSAGPLPKEGYINGCACGFKRTLLEEMGGFDPSTGMVGDRLWYHEENELYHRLKAVEKEVIYQPDAIVYHRSHQKTPKAFLQAAFAKGRSKKHWSSPPFLPTFMRWGYTLLVRTITFPYYWITRGWKNALVEQFSEVYRLTGLLY